MKQILVILGILAATFAISWAQGPIGRDNVGIPTSALMPTATEVLSFTKSGTLNTTALHGALVQPTVAVTMKYNGAGTGWPIAQNAVQELRFPSGVDSVVFSAPSSSAAAPNKVHYLPH